MFGYDDFEIIRQAAIEGLGIAFLLADRWG